MNEILLRLKEILKNNTDNKYKFIDVMTDTEALLLKRIDQYPAITIQAQGEDHNLTDISLLNKRQYKIKLRLWYVQIKQNNPRLEKTGFNNIFEASNLIIDTLYKDKRLNNLTSGMNELISINDWQFLTEEGNRILYVGRDIELSYYQFITFSSKENSQQNTSLPYSNESCSYITI